MTASGTEDDRTGFAELVDETPDDIVVVETDEDAEIDPVVDGTPARRRPVWPFLMLGGALLGFGASFAASYYTRPAGPDLAPLRAEIASLGQEVEALKALSAQQAAAPAPDLSAVERRIAALESAPEPDMPNMTLVYDRLTALEEAEPPEINEDYVARLEALKADGFDATPPPDLAELEARLRSLESEAIARADIDPAEDMSREIAALSARLDALEARPVAAAAPVAAAPITLDPATLPRFPADRLRAGAAEAAGEGFLRRSLSRHVRVKDEGSAEVLIGQVEDAMEAGDVRAAVVAFDRLPGGLRDLARGWRAEMEDLVP